LASLETRPNLLKHIKPLSTDDLVKLCDALHIRTDLILDATTLQEADVDIRDVLLEALVTKFVKRESQIDKINSTPLYPNEVKTRWISSTYPSSR